jgi:hypothetical protein
VDEILKLAIHYGCKVRTGGNHQCAIYNTETGYVVPLPQHSSTVKQAYIKELRELFGDEEARRKYGE